MIKNACMQNTHTDITVAYRGGMFHEHTQQSKSMAQFVEQDAAFGRGCHLSPQHRVLTLHVHHGRRGQQHDAR